MKKRRTSQIVIIGTLILVPALYAFLFLWAYWNPAGNLSDFPIAVVNCDQGYTIHSEYRNIGGELAGSLNDNKDVNWVFTDKEDAEKGLLNQKYYAELIIPENFTEEIASAETESKTPGTLYFKSNDKNGMMASSLVSNIYNSIQSNISSTVTENITANLIKEIKEIPSGMQELSSALAQLDEASGQLDQGSSNLVEGQKAFNEGLGDLKSGLDQTDGGMVTISASLKELADKCSTFADALSGNMAKSQELADYAGQYKNGLTTLSANLNQYLSTSNQLLQNSKNLVSGLQSYLQAHPEAMADPNMQAIVSAISASGNNTVDPGQVTSSLSQALSDINAVYDKINGGIVKIKDGMATAADSSRALSDAVNKIYVGSSSLASGMNAADKGASKLSTKSGDLVQGEIKIRDGLSQMNAGITQIMQSVDDSTAQLTDSTNTLQGLDVFLSEPVKIEDIKITEAENTGTALTPFMVSLCLYIGGLMVMITIFSMKSIKFKELYTPGKCRFDIGLFRYQLIGVAQAVLIAFTVQGILGLKVQNIMQFYGVCILGSLAFLTLIQMLFMLLKSGGQLICLLLMICQLTAGGGVLPVDILPSFYKYIHPYLPMTYTVNALRNVILGIDPESYRMSIQVVALVALVSAGIVVLLSLRAYGKPECQNRKEVMHA